jgi:hypothetical protein
MNANENTPVTMIQGERKSCCDDAAVTGTYAEDGVSYVERTCECGTAWITETITDLRALGRTCY